MIETRIDTRNTIEQNHNANIVKHAIIVLFQFQIVVIAHRPNAFSSSIAEANGKQNKKYHIIRPIVRVRCVYCSLCMNVISARAYRIERIPAKNAIALNVFGAPIRYQMPWNDKKPFHIRVSECKSKTLIASFILNAFNLSIKQRNWRPLIRCIHTPTNRSEFRWPLLVAERMDAIKINIQFVSRLA